MAAGDFDNDGLNEVAGVRGGGIYVHDFNTPPSSGFVPGAHFLQLRPCHLAVNRNNMTSGCDGMALQTGQVEQMGSVPSTPAKNAARTAAKPTMKCQDCGSDASESDRLCPTCQSDLGFPNVRAATTRDEVAALSRRFKDARNEADNRGVKAEFDLFVSEVRSKSHVVVAVPPLRARDLLSDPRNIYVGYEKLVGSGSRKPAPLQDDCDRRAVGGKLFGSFAHEICYGVLSLDGTSLPNYGLVFLKLRDVAIKRRVSFLYENSYLFLKRHKVPVRGDLPQGYRSSWQNRADLAATKIGPMLVPGSNASDWARQVVVQGPTRSDDSCVEAHVFRGFDANAVENIAFAGPGASRAEKVDIKCINELMAKRTAAGGTP